MPCRNLREVAHSALVRHSGMRPLNSGLPEFSNIIVQVGNGPTWMAQTRNPAAAYGVWIPGSREERAPE
jgi:hypothetical protein